LFDLNHLVGSACVTLINTQALNCYQYAFKYVISIFINQNDNVRYFLLSAVWAQLSSQMMIIVFVVTLIEIGSFFLDRMKSVIILVVCLSTYCYGEQLLGGWSTSNDETLKEDCLKKALVNINGADVGDNIQSQVSNYVCKTQIVNGLNIKCTFVLNEQDWQCSYYKSFTQNKALGVQLEQCKQIEEENDDEQGLEQPTVSDENTNKEQRAVLNDDKEEEEVELKSLPLSENEEDDEAEIDALNKRNFEQNTINEDAEEEED
jgi:hypothetical protein